MTIRYPISNAAVDVQAAIDACNDLDIVQLYASAVGTVFWDSDEILINKAITIQGYGMGVTYIDISGTVLGSPTVKIYKQTTERVWFKDMTLTDLAGTHDSDGTGMHDIHSLGGWGISYWPLVFKRVRFELTGWNW